MQPPGLAVQVRRRSNRADKPAEYIRRELPRGPPLRKPVSEAGSTSTFIFVHRRSENRDGSPRERTVSVWDPYFRELTNDPRIRAEGLQWAKVRERVEPWQSWSYAMEAEFTTEPSDRERALAMTYYLDPRSLRLSRFSKTEVDQAAKKFNSLNIFKKKERGATTT
jgi:hypothetical protein